jgi:hypothetical protein
MAHADAMSDRLPQLYRDGELVRGLLAVAALQLEVLDEDAVEVQRAHWFDATFELDEAARLAALLDVPPESWQSLEIFRAWTHSLRDARLQTGAVTREAIEGFVREYATLFQQAVDETALPPLDSWEDAPSASRPAFVENPSRWKEAREPEVGGLEPLSQFSIVQRGLDETRVGFLLVGLPSAPESAPLVANLTTGEALVLLGTVGPGQRLWLRPTGEGGVEAQLEGQDVSDRLRSIENLLPGTPWEDAQVHSPARAITLARGRNDFWFLPVAHYDVLGLDRFLLALASLDLHEARYDRTAFDRSIFYLDPAISLRAAWVETEPASFEVDLPAGTLLNAAGVGTAAQAARDELGSSLQAGVQSLRAAGVRAEVRMRPFAETQRQTDFLLATSPLFQSEIGPTGADALPDAGGLFDVTSYENSTFR